EGRIDFEGHVPDQRTGSASGNRDFSGTAQSCGGDQTDWRSEERRGRLGNFGLRISDCGFQVFRNQKSAICNQVSGPDAESERSDSQIALGASDIFPVAMQQL